MPNRPELIVHYLACFKAGLVATPLNYRYTALEVDHALAVSKARALLAHVERAEDLAASELTPQLALGTISYGGRRGVGPAFDDLIEGRACGVPELGPGSLTSGNRRLGMIPACRCGYCI